MMPRNECVMKFLTPSRTFTHNTTMERRYEFLLLGADFGSLFDNLQPFFSASKDFPSSVSLCVVVLLTIRWCVYENSMNACEFRFVCAVAGADGWWKGMTMKKKSAMKRRNFDSMGRKGDVSSQRQHDFHNNSRNSRYSDDCYTHCDVPKVSSFVSDASVNWPWSGIVEIFPPTVNFNKVILSIPQKASSQHFLGTIAPTWSRESLNRLLCKLTYRSIPKILNFTYEMNCFSN